MQVYVFSCTRTSVTQAAACVTRFELSESLRLAPATLAVTSITEEVADFVCEVVFEAEEEEEVVCFNDEAEVLVIPFVVGFVDDDDEEELVAVVVVVVVALVANVVFVSVTHFSYIFSSCFWVIQPGGHMP